MQSAAQTTTPQEAIAWPRDKLLQQSCFWKVSWVCLRVVARDAYHPDYTDTYSQQQHSITLSLGMHKKTARLMWPMADHEQRWSCCMVYFSPIAQQRDGTAPLHRENGALNFSEGIKHAFPP